MFLLNPGMFRQCVPWNWIRTVLGSRGQLPSGLQVVWLEWFLVVLVFVLSMT